MWVDVAGIARVNELNVQPPQQRHNRKSRTRKLRGKNRSWNKLEPQPTDIKQLMRNNLTMFKEKRWLTAPASCLKWK